MRDLIVVLLVLATVPYAFRRPFVGLCVFSWLAYMRPQDLCWGFARSMRLSFLLGITMVVGFFAFDFGKRPFFQRWGRCWLMILLALLVTVSLIGAYKVDQYVWRYYFEFVKIIVVALFTTGQVDSKKRLRLMLWTIALSLGFFGFKGGMWGVLTGGQIRQGPGGMMGDNNDFALAMVMNLPILFYLGRIEGNLMVRRFADICFFFSCVTIILTHSRGGFLSMVVVMLLLAWRSGHLLRAVILLGIGGLIFLNFAPDHVMERLATLEQGTEEGSANARIRSWTVALRIIDGNPWFGVGLRNFRHGYLEYGSEFARTLDDTKVAHNSYLQIWAEAGSIAFLVYLSLIASIFLAARRVRRLADGIAEFKWASGYARAFEITTAGFMLGSTFLNRGHFDLLYHWVALSGCMLVIFEREYRQWQAGTHPSQHVDGPPGAADATPVPTGPVRPSFRGRGAAVASGLPVWNRPT